MDDKDFNYLNSDNSISEKKSRSAINNELID
jgi:hypothetical protein